VTLEQAKRIAAMKKPVIVCHPDDASRFDDCGLPVWPSQFAALGKAYAIDTHGMDSDMQPPRLSYGDDP
jgi:hypothetical protein